MSNATFVHAITLLLFKNVHAIMLFFMFLSMLLLSVVLCPRVSCIIAKSMKAMKALKKPKKAAAAPAHAIKARKP